MKYFLKNKILSLWGIAASFFFLPLRALGAETLKKKIKGGIDALGINVRAGDPYDIIGAVLKSLFAFIGVIFFLLALFAGFLWMTSAGNEQKISRARAILLSSVLGIFIIFTSYIITVYVIYLLSPS